MNPFQTWLFLSSSAVPQSLGSYSCQPKTKALIPPHLFFKLSQFGNSKTLSHFCFGLYSLRYLEAAITELLKVFLRPMNPQRRLLNILNGEDMWEISPFIYQKEALKECISLRLENNLDL